MKGFKDSTKMHKGEFNFSRSSTPVKGHTRAMPKVASGGDPMPRPKPKPTGPVPLKTGGMAKGRC